MDNTRKRVGVTIVHNQASTVLRVGALSVIVSDDMLRVVDVKTPRPLLERSTIK